MDWDWMVWDWYDIGMWLTRDAVNNNKGREAYNRTNSC